MGFKNNSLFHVQGGFGKHVAATAVAKCIKNNSSKSRVNRMWCLDSKIYPEPFPIVDRVYQLGNTSYYYQTYVEGYGFSLIFANEPYFTTDHVNKKLPLIQTWR